MGLTRVHNTSDMVESRHYCIVVPTCPYPSGVKTGELVHTRQSQDGVWWRYIEGRFWQNNHTRVQWRQNSCADHGENGKWALYTWDHVSHTHIWKTAKLSDKTHKHCPLLEKIQNFFFIFVRNSSIGQQLSQHSQHHTPSMELHYTNSCQQLSAHIYSTHVLNFRVGPKAPQPFIYPFVYQPTYMHNNWAHLCMRPNKQGEWGG